MKKARFNFYISIIIFLYLIQPVKAQTASPVQDIFPKGTVTYSNVSYAHDTLTRHLMDVYLPPNTKGNLPLIVFIHGGAWMLNSKYSDMGYMKNTVKSFIDSGYALASIDYRYSTQVPFPAQIQDCNQAVEYLFEHAAEYKIDKNRIAVIGFSAGGHLASLMGLSNNNEVKAFYPPQGAPHFKIKCVLDFYGPANLEMMASNPDTSVNNSQSPLALLLGDSPIARPDLARNASPITYIDKNDPPFIIVQGEKDESVPNTQSKMLSSWLTLTGIPNVLIIVPNAPHFGSMFDADFIRLRLFNFLAMHLH